METFNFITVGVVVGGRRKEVKLRKTSHCREREIEKERNPWVDRRSHSKFRFQEKHTTNGARTHVRGGEMWKMWAKKLNGKVSHGFSRPRFVATAGAKWMWPNPVHGRVWRGKAKGSGEKDNTPLWFVDKHTQKSNAANCYRWKSYWHFRAARCGVESALTKTTLQGVTFCFSLPSHFIAYHQALGEGAKSLNEK